jgi:hypothetical protein
LIEVFDQFEDEKTGQNYLISMMTDLVLEWREQEKLKCILVEDQVDFNLYDAFEALDKRPRKGFITQIELLECIEDSLIIG